MSIWDLNSLTLLNSSAREISIIEEIAPEEPKSSDIETVIEPKIKNSKLEFEDNEKKMMHACVVCEKIVEV